MQLEGAAHTGGLPELTASLQQIKQCQQCRPPGAQGVDLSALLFNIHDFFLYLGVDEIRKRSSSDDKPLRMVKTILHELCKMLVGRAGKP